MRVKHGENRTPRFALAVFPLDSAKKLQRAPRARSVCFFPYEKRRKGSGPLLRNCKGPQSPLGLFLPI
jgi:hypothetical protein